MLQSLYHLPIQIVRNLLNIRSKNPVFRYRRQRLARSPTSSLRVFGAILSTPR